MDKINDLKKWKNNEILNAREYVYERDTVVDKVNEIVDDKVAKAGDTMTGALAFTAGQQAGVTRINMNNNKVVTTDGINATTFNNGDDDTDAVRYSELSNVFDVSLGSGSPNYQTTLKTNITSKFNEYAKISDLSTDFLRRDGTFAMTNDLNLNNNDIINLDGIASLSTEIGNKVNKTTTIAGIDLQNNITLQEIKDEIGEATTSLSGLMSSNDKTALNNLVALLATNDADNVVNTIGEVLAIFSQYPEGADLVTALSNKVETSVVGNRTYTQDTVVTSGQSITASIDALAVEMETKVDKVQGKELTSNDFTTTLKDKLDGIASGAEVNVQSNFTESDNTSDAFILNIPSTFPPSAHGHIISEVTNLETELSGKEPTFTKNTAFNKNFGSAADTVTEGNDARLSDARTPLSHSHVISDVTGLETALGTKPTIDPQTGKIPVSVIPFQFDDVLQGYIDQNVFYEEDTFVTVIPAAQGKLYIDISTNDIYRYDGTNYVLVKEAVGALGDIPNVVLTSEASGDLLRYNGTNWVNDLLPIEDLENVVITNVADGQYLKYDNETSKWVNTALDAPVIDSLNAIADVEADSPSSGDILQYNASTTKWEKNRINFVSATAPTNPYVGDFWFDSSTLVLYVYYDDGDSVQWVNAVSGIVEGQPEELSDLTDVNVVSPTNGQVLKYNTSTQLFENKNNVDYFTTTIATGDWTEQTSGDWDKQYLAVKTLSGLLSTDLPSVDLDLTGATVSTAQIKITAFNKIFAWQVTNTNEITFYASQDITEELNFNIQVVR